MFCYQGLIDQVGKEDQWGEEYLPYGHIGSTVPVPGID